LSGVVARRRGIALPAPGVLGRVAGPLPPGGLSRAGSTGARAQAPRTLRGQSLFGGSGDGAAPVSPAFVGLGSNVEDRSQHLSLALGVLCLLPDSHLLRVSSLYDTVPVGDPRQPRYLNAVARLDT